MDKIIEKIEMKNAENFENLEVEVSGWLVKRIENYFVFRDGTRFFEGVGIDDDVVQQLSDVTVESCCVLTGKVRRTDNDFYLEIIEIEVVNRSGELPVYETSEEMLREAPQLYVRRPRAFAMLKIRDEVAFTIHEFFHRLGCVKIDTPILTTSLPDGVRAIYEVSRKDFPVYLNQAQQLHQELAMPVFKDVYSFGSVFRNEPVEDVRHLNEFSLLECSLSFRNQAEVHVIEENLIRTIVRRVIENCSYELSLLDRDIEVLKKYATSDFARISYDDVIELLQDHANYDEYPAISWGEELEREHENYVANYFSRPTFIMDYPKAIKPFVMESHPTREDLVVCSDLIAPEGYGEIVGGGVSSIDSQYMIEEIEKAGLDFSTLDWYFDLVRFGNPPHAGFGMGLERVVAWITKADSIIETTMYPRTRDILKC